MAITSVEVYGVIIAGWASNSKYAFLGALRASAQMVSYEIAIGFCLVVVLMVTGSLNVTDIVHEPGQAACSRRSVACRFLSWNWLPLLPICVVYFISGLAETNRHPFDVVEGESEIVAGHMVEYSGMAFAMFFLAEYANMILISAISVIMFLGGWHAPISFSVVRRWRRPPGSNKSAWFWNWAWLFGKTFCVATVLSLGPRELSALSLRPDHAARLEDLHSGDARVAGGRRPRGSSRRGISGSKETSRWRPLAQPHHPVKTILLELSSRRTAEGHGAHRPAFLVAQDHDPVSGREDAALARGSVGCMPCGATRTAKSAASPASCARRSARHWRSRSNPTCATTARVAPPATTST